MMAPEDTGPVAVPDNQVREQAVTRMLAEGANPKTVAREFGLHIRQARHWLEQAKAERYDQLTARLSELSEKADELAQRVVDLEDEKTRMLGSVEQARQREGQALEEAEMLRGKVAEFVVERKALLSTLSVQYSQIKQVRQRLLRLEHQ